MSLYWNEPTVVPSFNLSDSNRVNGVSFDRSSLLGRLKNYSESIAQLIRCGIVSPHSANYHFVFVAAICASSMIVDRIVPHAE